MNRGAGFVGWGSLCVMLAVAACLDVPVPVREVEAETIPSAVEESANQQEADTIHIIAAELASNLPTHADGARLVESVCTACHSVEPPPTLAPPLVMVVRHYMEAYSDRDEAKRAISNWVVAPNPDTSGLPVHAIERFGLMPPIPLTEAQRDAVADYLVDEFAGAQMGGGMNSGMGEHMPGGMGERMRRRGGSGGSL